MLSFEHARDTILKHVITLDAEQVELLDALGRVCAEDVRAPINLPIFNNSSMDGFAVRTADRAHFAHLRVSGYLPAGVAVSGEIPAATAVRIMTGAPVPAACDAVVPFEEVEERDGFIRMMAPVKVGQHVRLAGEDVRAGALAMRQGAAVRVPEISVLASLGRTSLAVVRRPRVAILSTGDELVEPGQPLAAGRLFNSNSAALAAAVRHAGAIPVSLGIAADNHESLRETLSQGLRADVLITAAGVSMGDRDLVREVLGELGVRQVFWGITVKPGKSTAFGLYNDTPVFSLPGNPVSAIVTFEELVRPALLKMMGHRAVFKPELPAILQEEIRKPAGRTQLLRVRLAPSGGRLLAWSAGNQDTRFLRTLLNADALAVLPCDRTLFEVGEEIHVHLLGSTINFAEPQNGHEPTAPVRCEGALSLAEVGA